MSSLQKSAAFWVNSGAMSGIAVLYTFKEGRLLQFIPNKNGGEQVVATFREDADRALLSVTMALALTSGTPHAPSLLNYDGAVDDTIKPEHKAFVAALHESVDHGPALAELDVSKLAA